MRKNNLVGEVFSRLTVTGIHGTSKNKNLLWHCRCVCGGEAIAFAYDLRAGKVKSCGCLAKEGNNIIHGMGRKGKKRSKEYSIWAAMINRCTNKRDRGWENYGGRGITVCDSWKKFENFYADMGLKPEGKTLDRIDNNKGYNKENCEWRSIKQQSRNRRDNVRVKVQGVSMILADALKETGCCLGKLHYRMNKHNITHQEALDLWLQQKKI